MTPEQAIKRARAIAKRYGRFRDEVESEALYAYVVALRSWRPDGGVSLPRYVRRRINGSPREVLRREVWNKPYTNYATDMGELSESRPIGMQRASKQRQWRDRGHVWESIYAPESTPPTRSEIVSRIARIASRRAAHAAWLYYGLDYTLRQVGAVLGVTDSRVLQILKALHGAVRASA